jgi:hypothetical protein
MSIFLTNVVPARTVRYPPATPLSPPITIMATRMFPLSHFPELPVTKSLLIKGEYHPSVPIHFCISHLSHVNDEDTAVFITPSKESFVQTLVAYNDRWLGKYGGSGEVAAKLSRVKALFVAEIPKTVYMRTI